jgi:glucose-6-phosphate-specific signal transduction histidine kinase
MPSEPDPQNQSALSDTPADYSRELLLFAQTEQTIVRLEAERRRVAGELEQSLGSSLSLLLAQAGMYEQSLANNPTARMAVAVLASLARQSLQQLRDIIANLNPAILNDLGLEAAIESLAAQLTRTYGVHFKLNLKRQNEKLPEQTAIVLYRAVQEVLDYIITRTQANQLTISTAYSREKLTLQITSNGLLPLTANTFHGLSAQLEGFGGEFKIEPVRQGFSTIYFSVAVLPAVELTRRELEVLQQLGQGLSNKQIAQNLQLSPRTVNFHLDNIYTKLAINSRTEAVLYALRYGLISSTR